MYFKYILASNSIKFISFVHLVLLFFFFNQEKLFLLEM